MSKQEVIQAMKQRVYEANIQLPEWELVKLTWGNVSEINRELGVIVIKPSGVDYKEMKAEQMVVTDLDGRPVEEGGLKPSSDMATHAELYKHFEEVNAIVHTHSLNAVAWAQAGQAVPVYGTTHADAFYGNIPITRQLTQEEVDQAYELNTGKVIVEKFQENNIDPISMPGVLVNGHAPFTWGTTTKEAIENSLILDEVCLMAEKTQQIQSDNHLLPQYVLDKHYERKHGENAYYGQN